MAVYDDGTGETSVYCPGVAEDAASIMKVDILSTLLAEDQAHGAALTTAQDGLSQDMIEHSDNADAQDLWEAEGGATAVTRFDTAAGVTRPHRTRPGTGACRPPLRRTRCSSFVRSRTPAAS